MNRVSSRGFLLAILCFASSTFAADAPTRADMARWQREDVEVFLTDFLSLDRSFTPEARKQAEARLDALIRAPEPLTPAAFSIELCRVAALADNGHTQCLPPRVGRQTCEMFAELVTDDARWCKLREPDFHISEIVRVPIGFYPFGEEFYVIRVKPEHERLLGARLAAVDGKAVVDMRAVLRTFSGGTPAYRDVEAARVLASPVQLHAVGLASDSRAVTYELVLPDGKRVTQQFTLPADESTQVEWRRLPRPERAPWALQEPDKAFRFRDAPEASAVVIQLRQILDSDQKITDFLLDAERRRKQLGRSDIVLDMRENGGGNLLLARDFMTSWPSRTDGRFYVLTSRETFSAAIATLGYLKQAGGDRVVIVGEPIGDRLVFFSDGLPVQLPHSGLFFLPAVLRMDFADGCRKYDDCFEGVAQPGGPAGPTLLKLPPGTQRMPIAVRTLDPDVYAPWTIQSWLDGTDPAMEAVVELQSKRSQHRSR